MCKHKDLSSTQDGLKHDVFHWDYCSHNDASGCIITIVDQYSILTKVTYLIENITPTVIHQVPLSQVWVSTNYGLQWFHVPLPKVCVNRSCTVYIYNFWICRAKEHKTWGSEGRGLTLLGLASASSEIVGTVWSVHWIFPQPNWDHHRCAHIFLFYDNKKCFSISMINQMCNVKIHIFWDWCPVYS